MLKPGKEPHLLMKRYEHSCSHNIAKGNWLQCIFLRSITPSIKLSYSFKKKALEFLLKIALNWLEVAHVLLVDNQRLPLQ